MTTEEQANLIAKADAAASEAHGMLLDVYWAREKTGETVHGDALTHALGLLSDAIDTLRDAGESPEYLPAWEHPPKSE